MTIYEKLGLASRVAALAALVFAAGCGREGASSGAAGGGKSAVAERLADTSYRARLEAAVKAQKALAHERAEIARGLELQRRRARAALGAQATDAQVLAELEKNPVKYPEWAHLQARERVVAASLARERAAVQATVRARIRAQRGPDGKAPAPAAAK